MVKADIAEKVYNRIGFSKTEASDLVDKVLDLTRRFILQHKTLKIAGFGRFELRLKKATIGRNPLTREVIKIPPQKTISFKVSPKFVAMVNKNS